MTAYLLRRGAAAATLLWVVVTFVFFAVYLLPGDPALIILGGLESHPSPEQVAAVHRELGLDRPIVERYVEWLARMLRGDMGHSLITGLPVSSELPVRLSRTLQLIVPATVLAACIGLPAGVLAARRRGTAVDPLVTAIALLGFSVPVFVTGPVLVAIFSLRLGLLPSEGYEPLTQSPGTFLLYVILPACTLAAAPLATTMRMTRSSVLEQLSLDYVRTARSKGLGERWVFTRHVVRNALLPVLTIIGLQVGAMFAGSVLVETIFNWPGMNLYLLQGINQRDYPVIQSVVVVAAVIFILVNLLIDLAYTFLDPRIKYG